MGLDVSDEENESLRWTMEHCLYGHLSAGRLGVHEDLAHYTSAETAMNILQTPPKERGFWLRNATEMNDFSEISFGMDCLEWCFNDPETVGRLSSALNRIHPTIWTGIFQSREQLKLLREETYLVSLSAHGIREQQQGLLSMWRAYGGNANVCMIFNREAVLSPEGGRFQAALCPVSYDGAIGMKSQLLQMAQRLKNCINQLMAAAPLRILEALRVALIYTVLSTKHPSFREENEWRIIYLPTFPHFKEAVPSKVVCIDRIVQRVHIFPLDLLPTGKAPLLKRIVIGPTHNPNIVRNGFVDLLKFAGFPDADGLVVASGVPLRRAN